MRFYSLLILCCSLCLGLQGQNYLPKSSGEIVKHSCYTMSYNEEHEQAEWVYYLLSPELLAGSASRSDDFRPDEKVSTKSATLNDYKGSGYDRGHLCPAGSMTRSAEAMSESFFMSNMSPQAPSFNRGTWKRLEDRVRDYAMADSVLHVVTGPIFSDPIGVIGANEVTIPRYYFKALYSPKMGEMVGFVMENRKLDGSLEAYACTIDHIESLADIDLFADIDATQMEATYNITEWVANKTPQESIHQHTETKPMAKDNQCQGVTSSGKRCSRKAQSGSRYCWQHKQ